jgi:phosphomannomutase
VSANESSQPLSIDHHWDSFPAAMVVFDLDDTLAPSKSPLPGPMTELVARLLTRAQICIISGGRFDQFRSQVLDQLDLPPGLAVRLHLMPTCGTQYYRWKEGAWTQVYAEQLPDADRELIGRVLTEGARVLGLQSDRLWGPVLEDRGSQVTFSALGQAAPVDAKTAWDPDGSKRAKLQAYAEQRLPDLEVRSGGSTSIDVTRRGIDKAYGVRKLLEHTAMSKSDLLFVGDRLDPGGNDHPVLAMGVRSVAVTGWEQTATLLESLLALHE